MITNETETVLKETIPDKNMFEQYWNGNSEHSVCIKKLVPRQIKSYKDIVDGFADYLRSYPASPVYKERCIRQFLEKWLKSIAKHFDEFFPEENDYLPEFLYEDKTVELVKLLHDRDGITKEELHEKLGVSEKTIQTNLRLLSPSLRKNGKKTDSESSLKIGGYVVNANIREERKKDNRKYYCMPNTVHPIVLLPNLMQVGVLLKSLAQNKDSDVSIYTGADIWCQLSDYCKKKIWNCFALNDESLVCFINMIEYRIKHGYIPGFITERDMDIYSISEKLIMAVKAERICTVSIEKDNSTITRKRQKIAILKNMYRAASVEDSSDYIDFMEKNVVDIYFVNKLN
ncbi:MAG: hypothetical protein ACI4GV_08410 [Acutalibacteraceae bacterium]